MKWFHRHQWREIQRQFLEQQSYTPILFGAKPIGDGHPVTLITSQCECGEYNEQTLQGSIGKGG